MLLLSNVPFPDEQSEGRLRTPVSMWLVKLAMPNMVFVAKAEETLAFEKFLSVTIAGEAKGLAAMA